MKDKTNLLLSGLLILFAFNLSAQNTWNFTTPPSSKSPMADSCIIYHYEDIEEHMEWQYVLGEPDADNEAYDIVITPDNNFVYLYYSGFYKAYFLVCITQANQELWRTQIMVNDSISYGKKINLIGSEIYVTGSWEISNTRYFGVTKLDKDGNQLWFKQLFSDTDNRKRMREFNPYLINVENNNFLGSFIESNSLYVAKFNNSFDVLWKKTIEELGCQKSVKVFNTAFYNSTYHIFASATDSCFYSSVDFEGNILKTGVLVSYHFEPTFYNNSIYFTGSDYWAGIQWLKKYNENLELDFKFNVKENSRFYDAASITVLNDNSIYVFYDYEYYGTMNGDMHRNFNIHHISKWGACVSILDLHAYGNQYSKKMLKTNTDAVILFGHGYHIASDKDRISLIKIKPYDPVSIKNSKVEQLIIYPNPTYKSFSIELPVYTTGAVKLYTVTGILVYSANIVKQSNIEINLSGYKNGTYLIQIQTKDKTFTNKIIKV